MRTIARARLVGHDLAAHEEFECRGPVRAAADQERDVLPLDPEPGRGQRAGGAVAVEEGVDESLPPETADVLLPGEGPSRGPRAEAVPLRPPVAIGIALEVGDQDVFRGVSDGETCEETD